VLIACQEAVPLGAAFFAKYFKVCTCTNALSFTGPIYLCSMMHKFLIGIVWVAFLAACNSTPPPEEPKTIAQSDLAANEHGKKLFYAKCASCHMVNKDMSGPALKGVENRWPDKQKLYAFIRNSEAVIKQDKYARELWLQWNQTTMLPHPDLTDADISAILEYIKSVSI
jgi:mono/diheme cytochrome c family protein